MRSEHEQLFRLAIRDLLVGYSVVTDRLGCLKRTLTTSAYRVKAIEFLLNQVLGLTLTCKGHTFCYWVDIPRVTFLD